MKVDLEELKKTAKQLKGTKFDSFIVDGVEDIETVNAAREFAKMLTPGLVHHMASLLLMRGHRTLTKDF